MQHVMGSEAGLYNEDPDFDVAAKHKMTANCATFRKLHLYIFMFVIIAPIWQICNMAAARLMSKQLTTNSV